MNELERLIHDRIQRHGPLPFGAFMQLALYHPRFGYYAAGRERTAWRGDFVTSPEISPAYGTLWGRAVEKVRAACGSPESFEVVEVGPGEAGFAHALLSSLQEPVRYRLVERVPAVQERQAARLEGLEVSWSASVTEVPQSACGVVFANEVLDNLPVHLVERRDGSLLEVCVDSSGGRLVETLRPPAGPELEDWLARAGAEVRDGHRFEVTMAAESFVRHCAAALSSGAIVLVDYGGESAELAQRPRGTVVAYGGGGPSDDVLARPGEQDVTAHANWTIVRGTFREMGWEVTGPLLQRDALLALGAGGLDDELRAAYSAALEERRGAEAVRALSRRSALGALLDAGGLGGLGVLIATKGIAPGTLP